MPRAVGGGPGAALGVLGGTFDPVHLGHLACARLAAAALGLRRVLVVPAGQPQLRAAEPVAPAADRWAMVQLACDGDERLVPCRLELDRPGPTYTVDTLAALADQGHRRLVLILGADVLAALDRWRDPAGVCARATLAVCPRPGVEVDAQAAARLARRRWRARVVVLPASPVPTSSSEIRDLVRAGRPYRHLVPAAVADYIRDRGLYGATGA